MANNVRQSITSNMRGTTDQGKRSIDTTPKQFVAYSGTIAAASGTVDVVIDTKGYTYCMALISGVGNAQATIYPRMLDGTKVTTPVFNTSTGKKLDMAKAVIAGLDSVVLTVADLSAVAGNQVKVEFILSHAG